MPRIAMVTVCKGRLEHLANTLPQNLADNVTCKDLVFVVLGYNDNEGLSEYIFDNHMDDLDSGRLAFYQFSNGNGFHMAHSKNMAMRCAMNKGAEILCTVDADNRIGPGFAHFLEDRMGDPGFHMSPDHYKVMRTPHGPERPQRGYAGRLAIRAQDFTKLGGYDESFDTWRGEDIDILARCRRIGFPSGFIPNRFLDVIPHGSAVRFKEFPHAKVFERAYEFQVITRVETTVVNYGNTGCGTVYRNFSPEPIKLDPFPTRVFGIGMHKTATTSLHHAFQTLGLDSWHWKSNRQAWRIFSEMNRLGRSTLLEQSYSLCDNPIPILYRKLDLAYPGSKFILTMLSDEKWLDAVECLWDPSRNPYHDWDKQPFSHMIHEAIYGQRHLDRSVFLARYHRHNRDVLEYFRNRPGDLLVMNMSEGAGWDELCGFLGKPIPNIPYPHAHKDQPKYWNARHNLHAGDL